MGSRSQLCLQSDLSLDFQLYENIKTPLIWLCLHYQPSEVLTDALASARNVNNYFPSSLSWGVISQNDLNIQIPFFKKIIFIFERKSQISLLFFEWLCCLGRKRNEVFWGFSRSDSNIEVLLLGRAHLCSGWVRGRISPSLGSGPSLWPASRFPVLLTAK